MKKLLFLLLPAMVICLVTFDTLNNTWSQNTIQKSELNNPGSVTIYQYPVFYKGIYLNSATGKNRDKLNNLIRLSKESHINTMVIDIQDSSYRRCVIPKENVELCLQNGIHPIARIVVFPDGLKKFPIPKDELNAKYRLAEDACLNGFKEIQFDYVRFNDYGILRKLTLQQKYDFIENFLSGARVYLKKYNVKTAADVFGRIPLNRKDEIGQRMEGLDRVVDIICPMAYPSHYTWSQKYMSDPYHTVFITSKNAKNRVINAEIVTYIQAFKMKIGPSRLTFEKYIEEQIRAVHDSGVRGYLLWNARQEYIIPLKVAKNYYANEGRRISRSDKIEKNGRIELQ